MNDLYQVPSKKFSLKGFLEALFLAAEILYLLFGILTEGLGLVLGLPFLALISFFSIFLSTGKMRKFQIAIFVISATISLASEYDWF